MLAPYSCMGFLFVFPRVVDSVFLAGKQVELVPLAKGIGFGWAAAMVLKAQPGNYEFARRILGHRNIATTIRFYTALESFKAAEVFGAMMEEQMGNPGSGNAKHRIRRKSLTQPTSTLSGRGSEHGNK